MVTPLSVAAANFLSFSVPSPYTVLTAMIAAAMRSLSAGSDTAFFDDFLGVLLAALAVDLRTRFPVLVVLGVVGRLLSDLEASLACLDTDLLFDLGLPRDLLAFRVGLGGDGTDILVGPGAVDAASAAIVF